MLNETVIVVVEDDPNIADLVELYLRRENFRVYQAADGEAALRVIRERRPRLIVLDLGLPGGVDGFEVCRQVRATSDVPIIMLTARDDEVDRVLGLEMGADDLLGKPCSQRELLARVHAVLRRSIVPPGLPMLAMAPVPIGTLQFDIASRCLVQGGQLHVLSTVEYAVLAELVANPGVAVSRERLLAASHSRAEGLLLRAVDVAVMRLRKRVEPDPAQPRYLQTIRGHGYMFVPAAPIDGAALPIQRSRRSTPTGVAASPSMNSV